VYIQLRGGETSYCAYLEVLFDVKTVKKYSIQLRLFSTVSEINVIFVHRSI